MGRPVSIRRSLLINIIAMIGLLSTAIIVVAAVGARRAVARLSSSIIVQTTERVEERLHRFFDPLDGGLQIAGAWGAEGLLDLDRPERMRTLLAPFMHRYGQISSIVVADGRGSEYMLLRVGPRWTSREMNPDLWGRRGRFTEWTESQPEHIVTWRELDYDPRTRPWYRGAIRSRCRTIHWTEPYTFYTAQEPGITAAVAYDLDEADAVEHVIAFDVKLSEISEFTYGLRPSPRGAAFVMTTQGQVIGLPRDEQFADPDARRNAMLREASDLGVQMVQDGTRAYIELQIDDREAYRFVSDGRNWWAGVAPFELGPNRLLLMAVAVPAADLLEQIERLRWTIVVITVLVLAGALWRAAVLAHRYSEPIEALVRQSDRISRGDLEPGPAIASRVKEVRRLARAQERMRLGLRSLLKLERDLQLARQIQERTFPDEIPDVRGFRIDAWSEPAEETGGDTYDVVERGDRVVLLLADATGHGIGPAISVTQVRAMLRMAVQLDADLASIVRDLNKQLCADLPAGRFITVWLGEIDTVAGTLTSFSAGQAPIVRYDAAGGQCVALPADTVPLGVVPDLPVEIAEPQNLAGGDIVVVVSDGIYEALDAAGAQFGVDRVTQIITDHHDGTPAEIIAALREAVGAFTGDTAANDDRTGIVIKKRN